MGYYGAPTYPAAPGFDPCCPAPGAYPVYPMPVVPPRGYGSGFGIALIVVVVILLVILGAVYLYQRPAGTVV